MSLRWHGRIDRYQRGDEQFEVKLHRDSSGYHLLVYCEYYKDFEDGAGSVLCSDLVCDKTFEQIYSVEMYISRIKKRCCFTVNSLFERIYYY